MEARLEALNHAGPNASERKEDCCAVSVLSCRDNPILPSNDPDMVESIYIVSEGQFVLYTPAKISFVKSISSRRITGVPVRGTLGKVARARSQRTFL